MLYALAILGLCAAVVLLIELGGAVAVLCDGLVRRWQERRKRYPEGNWDSYIP